MKNRNHFLVNMSWWFPFILYFIAPPFGVILFILKLIAMISSDRDNKLRQERATHLDVYPGEYSEQQDEERKKEKIRQTQKKELSKRKKGVIALYILGAIAAIWGLPQLLTGLEWTFSGMFDSFTFFHELLPGAAGVAAAVAFIKNGLTLKSDLKDEELIDVIVGERDYITLGELRDITGYSYKKIRRLVKDAIAHGYFGSGAYIDVKNDTLVIRGVAPENPGAYKEPDFEPEKANITPENSKQDIQKSDTVDFETDNYQVILKNLHDINEAIEGEEMTAKITELENLSARIFELAKKDPKKKAMLGRFMSYYLPTSQKLLSTYATLDKQGYAGENMLETKRNIEDNMDSLVKAFRMQLDKLFEAEAMDISSDIATLNKIFDMDGISGNDFQTLNK